MERESTSEESGEGLFPAPRKKIRNFALEIAHFSAFSVTILYLCKYHVYNNMQRTWRQYISQYTTYIYTQKAPLPKIIRSYRGASPPLNPPLYTHMGQK